MADVRLFAALSLLLGGCFLNVVALELIVKYDVTVHSTWSPSLPPSSHSRNDLSSLAKQPLSLFLESISPLSLSLFLTLETTALTTSVSLLETTFLLSFSVSLSSLFLFFSLSKRPLSFSLSKWPLSFLFLSKRPLSRLKAPPLFQNAFLSLTKRFRNYLSFSSLLPLSDLNSSSVFPLLSYFLLPFCATFALIYISMCIFSIYSSCVVHASSTDCIYSMHAFSIDVRANTICASLWIYIFLAPRY